MGNCLLLSFWEIITKMTMYEKHMGRWYTNNWMLLSMSLYNDSIPVDIAVKGNSMVTQPEASKPLTKMSAIRPQPKPVLTTFYCRLWGGGGAVTHFNIFLSLSETSLQSIYRTFPHQNYCLSKYNNTSFSLQLLRRAYPNTHFVT
jgi:hypothetical protein